MTKVSVLNKNNYEMCDWAGPIGVDDTHSVSTDVDTIVVDVDYYGNETEAYKWEMTVETEKGDSVTRYAIQKQEESAVDTFEELYKKCCEELDIEALWKD